MASTTQDQRVAVLDTPLGKDVLLLERLNVTEALGEPFEIEVECLSEKRWIDFTPALGLNCSISLSTYGATRRFNGALVEAMALGPFMQLFRYRIILRPWLWLLTKRTNSRIFSETKVTDIIKEVFRKAGQTDFEDKLSKEYPKLEYCVQYRESDFAFVSRLMEWHGIYYYFKHTDSKHTLVLADDKSAHDTTPISKIPFIPNTGSDYRKGQQLALWHGQRRFFTGKVMLNEYNPLKASSSMKSESSGKASFAHSDYEHYEYPGQYDERGDGDNYARVRMEMETAQDERRMASGDAATLMAGELVTVERHYESSQNVEYLIVRSAHTFETEQFRSGGGTGGHDVASNFEFLESKTPYRSPFRTPKPRIFGVQTAKVVGKEGEEIDVDEHGRITVEFYWERDKKPSRRVRVAHVWAGKNWGGIHTPRIGMEAVVEFLEGDPDRPIVIGTVYNSDNKHPYTLPAEKTKSGLKTYSSKGGGGFNEFRFEDKKDSEEVFFHAQKDLNSVVLNQETRIIAEKYGDGGDARATTIKNGNDHLIIENGDDIVKISRDQKLEVGKDQNEEVKNNRTIKVGTKDDLDVGTELKIHAGMKISIDAGMQIELKVGGNKIEISPAGVTIVGTMVNIN